MSHVRRADWAAQVPWDGIIGKPAGLGGDTDIGQLKGAGFSVGDIPEWDGTQFVPVPYAPGGGGGAIANLDSPGVATKRINPSSGQTEQVWLREVFDVRQYGADNTGGADATGNFNSAITALNAAGGGALIIPAGRYAVSGTLNRILGRCWVHGDGQGSTIITFGADGWWVTSGSFFGCTGLTMIGSSAVATGIKIMDSASRDNFLLTDLRITGFGFSISVDTVNRAGWIERVRLEALELALSLTASDSFVRGISIFNGGDNTKNAFEMTGYRNQVSDFKLLGDSAHFKKGLFVNDGGNHIISGGIIIGCEEEAISLSNGTGGVGGCRVQNISWLDIGTDPDVVSYDSTTNYVNDLYEIGTGTPASNNVVLVDAPTSSLDPGENNQVANDGNYFYSFKDTNWYRVKIETWGGPVATGGVVTVVGLYTIHTFTANGSFDVSLGGDIDYLIVAGGGGGGGFAGGGGGGFKKLTTQTIGIASFPVVVGAGGAKAVSGSTKGSKGGDSSFNGTTADGGGGGGGFDDTNSPGMDGGSGGGGGANSTPPYTGRLGGNATVGQGNNGGAGVTGATAGGGGGGAGAVGADGAGNTGGAGGDGQADSISGAPVTYGAGGGGSGLNTGGAGGAGGGGGGGTYNGGAGPGSTAATGIGAGGGASYDNLVGTPTDGTGGIVIIRYLTP
jgi:hypothetical protein